MLFILSISFFIALHTFFGNFWPAVGGGFFLIVGVGVSAIFQKKSLMIFLKKSAIVVCAYFLTMLSVSFFVSSYSKKIIDFGSTYSGSGEIIENQGSGKYVFRDVEGREFLYYSDVYYLLGSHIFTISQPKVASGPLDRWTLPVLSDLSTKVAGLYALEWEFDMDRRMMMKGRVGVLYEKQAILLYEDASSWLLRWRQALIGVFQELYTGRVLGLSLGVFMGDRSYLVKEEYDSFIDSGLVHIIAVSGGNIVLLVGFLSAILFFLPYYIRSFFLAVSIIFYASLCGGDSSVVRASLMALLSIVAIFFGRTLHVRRSMGYVYVVMLLRNPYYLLYDLGFIFSFTALAGLAFFSQRRKMITKKKIIFRDCKAFLLDLIKRFWNLSLLPSVAAALGVFVPLMFFTSRVNLLSVLSNILVAPLIPIIMIYGFFSALLYSVTGRHRLAYPQQWSTAWIYAINKRSVDHSVVVHAESGVARLVVLVLACCIVVVIVSHKKKKLHRKREWCSGSTSASEADSPGSIPGSLEQNV